MYVSIEKKNDPRIIIKYCLTNPLKLPNMIFLKNPEVQGNSNTITGQKIRTMSVTSLLESGGYQNG